MTEPITHEPAHAVIAAIDADITAVLTSPGTSTWLQAGLGKALSRDLVDAASDAVILADLLCRRCNAILEAH